MKKLLLSAIAAIGLLLSPSCSDENEVLSSSENEALVSFNVQLADGISTKATSGTTLGNGTKATNLVVEVYEAGDASGNEVFRKDNVSLTNLKANVDFVLVKGKKYDIIFWAQKEGTTAQESGYYDVSDLREIKVNYDSKASNDENRDAFVAVKKGFSISGPKAIDVKLTRPFAQVNFMVPATDIAAANAASFNFATAKTGITISDVAKQLNPLSNTVGGTSQEATFAPAVIPFQGKNYAAMESTDADKLEIATQNYYYLATTYILVNASGETENQANQQALVNATLTICENGTNETHTIPVNNIPVQMNYRTNIYGDLLTASGTFNVEITPAFSASDNNQPLEEQSVASVADVANAIRLGARTITVTTAPSGSETLSIPKIFNNGNTETIKLIIPATSNNYTIGYTATDTGAAPANVEIDASGNEGNLTITLPQSTVTLNGSAYNQVTASTAANTLIIPNGVTVSTLNVNAGNVEINGIVTNLILADGCGVLVGTEAKLNDAITNSYSKIILKNDIALTADLEISKGVTIDGQETLYQLDLGTYAIKIKGGYTPIKFDGVDFYSNQTSTQFAIQANLKEAGNLYFNNCLFGLLEGGVLKAELSKVQGGNLFIEECCFKGPIENAQYLDISASGLPESEPTVKIIGNDFADMTSMAEKAINLDLSSGCIYVGNNSLEESTVTPEHGIHCGLLTLEQLISAFTDSEVDITLFDKTNN